MDQMNIDLIERIQKHYQRLSKGQKLIADYILSDYDKAAFMTASKLGKIVGVSESTVVRFANTLGFPGYPNLQKALQQLLKSKLTTVQRIGMNTDSGDEGEFVKSIMKADIENLGTTIAEVNEEVFEQVVDAICNAKRVYILGLRSSTALAGYLGFYLNLILDNVKVVSFGMSDIFEQMVRVSEEDVVIGISYPRYSRKTIDALKYVKAEGGKVIGLTDSSVSPIAEISDYTLLARSNIVSFVDSLVAPMSLINALIIAIGMRNKEQVTDYFVKLENVWEEYNVYEKKEKKEEY